MRSTLYRHGWLLAAAGLVLAVFVLAPGIGFFSRLIGPDAADPFAMTPTQIAALRETAQLMLGIAVLTSIIGVSTAWIVSVHEFPLRRWLDIGLVLPLAFPTYLVAYVAVDLLDFFGPVQSAIRAITGLRLASEYWFPQIRSMPGAVALLSLVLMPYIYVPCRILFSRTGGNIIEAARLLGASGFRLFFRIGLPIAKPAILTGLVLVLLEALNDIGAVEYLGISSLSAVIRDLWLNRFDLAGAARLAGLLIAIVVILLLIDPQSRSGRSQRQADRSTIHPRRVQLTGAKRWIAFVFCLTPVTLGFLVPAFHLVTLAIRYLGARDFDTGLLSAIVATVLLGLAVSGIVVIAGALIVIAQRATGRLRQAGPLTMVGYATPGTVLVLAIMPVFGAFDDALVKIGLPALFIGANAAVIYALSVRFLGLGTAQAGLALARLPTNVDAVARVHGYGDIRLATRIHWPAITPGLMLGAIVVFIDTVKELPATLLLRPLNVETLATRAYSRASAGMFEHGALDSLLIVAISATAAIALSRRS
ncbi:MAG: ABC transporter permease [Rhabdaerophilum sp.]